MGVRCPEVIGCGTELVTRARACARWQDFSSRCAGSGGRQSGCWVWPGLSRAFERGGVGYVCVVVLLLLWLGHAGEVPLLGVCAGLWRLLQVEVEKR